MPSANYNLPSAAAAPDRDAARTLIIPHGAAGMRLDQALAQLMPEHSRSRIKSWIEQGRVKLSGQPAAARQRLRGGEIVSVVPLAEPRTSTMTAQRMELNVVHEDDALIVVDKPAGLVVHPGSGNWSGTLANALLHHAPQLAALPRAGIVHRLDKDTSGLLVIAKTATAQTDLVRQLQARTVRREYLALAIGDLAHGATIDAPIGRHPVRRTSMAVVATGKPARTRYEVRERFGDCTLLGCRLETGRTHQIRVHLASISHPLLGDPAYGRRHALAFGRQALHASRLGLVHPLDHRAMQWEAPLPADFSALLASLRRRAAAAHA